MIQTPLAGSDVDLVDSGSGARCWKQAAGAVEEMMTVVGTWMGGCAVIVVDAYVYGTVVDPAEVAVVGCAFAELLTEGPATVVGDSD